MPSSLSLGRRLAVMLASTCLLSGNVCFAADKVSNFPPVKPEELREGSRLSPQILPEKYDLYFEPNFDNAEFEGSEVVYLDIQTASRTIKLNSLNLSVFDASIASREKGHGDFIKAEVSKDDQKQLVTLNFAKPLSPGRYELHLKFSGHLSEKLAGFYLSRFKDDKGKEHKIATTQMEPTDARRMFPCFDEPAFKAAFKVTCAIPTNMVAISNASQEFEKLDQRKDKKVVTFKATPAMSTYLFALVIGEFAPSKDVDVDGKKIRVWAPAGKQNLTGYALDTAAKLMPYYEKYFGVNYPFDKLDLIAVPDFSAGAMENFGAITFRETALLIDDNASTRAKMRVTGIIAHEMAHLWFGDLVTMKWWNDLWLNEAFATWMATKATEKLKPEWHNWDDFALSRASTLDSDGLLATRAVEYPVKSPEDAMEMFDEITYEKGGSLLRMLEMYLGEDKFQAGIQRYMQEHKFANATTGDLWQALSVESGSARVDVAELMKSWVYTPGCPLVTMTEGKSTAKKKGTVVTPVTISQERFLRGNVQPKGEKALWQIPVVLKGDSYSQKQVFDKESQAVSVNAASAPLFVNGMGNGFYRTRYSAEQLAKLQTVKKDFLNCAEKVSLASDVYSLAFSARTPIKNYLDYSLTMAGDNDPYVLSLLIGQTLSFEDFAAGEENAYAAYVRSRLKPQLANLGFEKKEGEAELISQLRGQLIKALGTVGQDPECMEFCRSKFDLYLAEDANLDPDLLSAIVNVVAYNGDQDDYARITQAFKLANTPEAYERNLGALCTFRQKELVTNSLDMVLTKDVRAQDGPRQIGRLLASSWGRTLAWQFLNQNWEALAKKFDAKHLPHLIEAAGNFNSEEDLKNLTEFVGRHPLPNGRRSVAKTIETVQIRLNFRQKQMPDLLKYLKEIK
ncbi:MAG: M1 family metallopeptidase [Candidatus Obscuribacter sp.]|nr:M1 family metallopeptidase [Candidatus Obscuribacter sp.]